MGALEDLRAAGKIRAIAASNVTPTDVAEYLEQGRLDGIQERYNALDRELEAELIPLCLERGVSIMSYSSLAMGILSGKVAPERVFEGDDQRGTNPRFSPQNRARVAEMLRRLDPLCAELGVTTAQLVIAWTLSRPGITYALCGARTPAHAVENARAGTLRAVGGGRRRRRFRPRYRPARPRLNRCGRGCPPIGCWPDRATSP